MFDVAMPFRIARLLLPRLSRRGSETSTFPGFSPIIERILLSNLAKAKVLQQSDPALKKRGNETHPESINFF